MANNIVEYCVFCKGAFEEALPTDTRIDCECGESFAVRTYLKSSKADSD